MSKETAISRAFKERERETAIAFSIWKNKNGWVEYDDPDRLICPSDSRKVYTTEQVYEKFITPKNIL